MVIKPHMVYVQSSSQIDLLAALQVRLMLVLAPAACCLAGIALHEAIATLFKGVHAARDEQESKPPKEDVKAKKPSRPAKVSFLAWTCPTLKCMRNTRAYHPGTSSAVTKLARIAGRLLVHSARILRYWPAHSKGCGHCGVAWLGSGGPFLHVAQHLGQCRDVFCPLHSHADPWR